MNKYILQTYKYIYIYIHIYTTYELTCPAYIMYKLYTPTTYPIHPTTLLLCGALAFNIVSVCCSVLQRVAVCCSVMQYVAVCCSVLQRVTCLAFAIVRTLCAANEFAILIINCFKSLLKKERALKSRNQLQFWKIAQPS